MALPFREKKKAEFLSYWEGRINKTSTLCNVVIFIPYIFHQTQNILF